jgi:FAD/FMN-containing dehydrogenase
MSESEVCWTALARGIAGEVIPAGTPGYDTVRKPPMVRFHDVRPEAVVRCTTPADVSATIAFARRRRLPLAVRSGGHSVAGRSSTHGIVVDVTPMASVSLGGGLATVGSGVRLGRLYDALDAHGVTIPAGCGHSVGIAGLTLGGGIGIMGRSHGLTCDSLLRAEIVLADGRVLECDDERHGDLFWALRGAGGGNFGVVTSFVFRAVPAPAATVFRVLWPFESAAQLVEAWQGWAPFAPDEVDATLRLLPGRVEVFGAVLAGDGRAAGLLGELIRRVGAEPEAVTRRELSYREAKRDLDQGGSLEHESANRLFTKSEFFRRPLPREAIAELVANLARDLPGVESREIAFLPWGGAYNRLPPDAVAFPHRSESFVVQHLVEIGREADTRAGRAWLVRSWEVLHPSGSGGVYVNFPDPELEDWQHAYFGANFERLVRVKAAYDPNGFFRFEQSIPTR